MRPLPSNQLDPSVKTVWRISAILRLVLYFLGSLSFILPICFAAELPVGTVLLVLLAVFVLVALVRVLWWPNVRYKYWRYEVGENELDIANGVVWRKRFVIPFVRVQNTDTRQGPILRMLGLSSVTVSTAAGSHVIPGLRNEAADHLRDLIAEQARLAQEDV